MIKSLLKLVSGVALMCASAFGQIYSNQSIANSPQGFLKPAPFSKVYVCSLGSTYPCPALNLLTLYTDQTLGTACTGSNGCGNPLQTDSGGNYTFYATPGFATICALNQNVSFCFNTTIPGIGGGGGGGGTPGLPLNSIQTNISNAFVGIVGSHYTPPAPPGSSLYGQLSFSNFGNTRYATADYAWTQSPAGTVSAGVNTIALTPCPAGIMTVRYSGDGIHPWTYIHIAGTGVTEDALVTATTCSQQGGANGTVTFTAANVHSAGFTLGSSSSGIQEACNAALYDQKTGGAVVVNFPGKCMAEQREYKISAPVSFVGLNFTFDASNAILTCTMTGAPCIVAGDLLNQNASLNLTFIGLHPKPKAVGNTAPFFEDNAQSTTILGLSPVTRDQTDPNTVSFGHLIQNDDDEASNYMYVSTVTYYEWGGQCTTTFCPSAIYNPPGRPGIVRVSHSNLSQQCFANQIDLQGSNAGHSILDTILQGQPQFGVRTRGAFGQQAISLDKTYWEVGNCTNPLGIGVAGLIVQNGSANVTNSVGPSGAAQRFANTGGTQYNYWVVIHGTTGPASSVPLPIGYALTNGVGNITVAWKQYALAGTVTYDILRTTGTMNINGVAPYTAICGGGTPTTCGSVATGLTVAGNCAAVGSTNICTFVDNSANNTSAYTVPILGANPNLDFIATSMWNGNDGPINSGGALIHLDKWQGSNDSATLAYSAIGMLAPTYQVGQCDADFTSASAISPGIWMQCEMSTVGGVNQQGATLINDGVQNTAMSAGQKGTTIYETGPAAAGVSITDLITLSDSNPAATLAAARNRPGWDINDTAIGFDANVAAAAAQLYLRAPVAVSNYIGVLPTGSNWLERLTSTLKSFKVPITTNSQITSTVTTGTQPFIVNSQTQVANLNAGFINGLAVIPLTDTPGAITVNAQTCTDRAVAMTTITASATISVSATYALEANIFPAGGQAVAGVAAHYRICNATGGNITLAAAASFSLKVIQ